MPTATMIIASLDLDLDSIINIYGEDSGGLEGLIRTYAPNFGGSSVDSVIYASAPDSGGSSTETPAGTPSSGESNTGTPTGTTSSGGSNTGNPTETKLNEDGKGSEKDTD